MENGGESVVVANDRLYIQSSTGFDKAASTLLFQNAALPSENVLVPPPQEDQRHPGSGTPLRQDKTVKSAWLELDTLAQTEE